MPDGDHGAFTTDRPYLIPQRQTAFPFIERRPHQIADAAYTLAWDRESTRARVSFSAEGLLRPHQRAAQACLRALKPALRLLEGHGYIPQHPPPRGPGPGPPPGPAFDVDPAALPDAVNWPRPGRSRGGAATHPSDPSLTLVLRLRRRGVLLTAEGHKLRVRAPRGGVYARRPRGPGRCQARGPPPASLQRGLGRGPHGDDDMKSTGRTSGEIRGNPQNNDLGAISPRGSSASHGGVRQPFGD